MNISIGSDHHGFALKSYIQQHIIIDGQWIDVGAHTDTRSDYPEFGIAAIRAMQNGVADKAILLCGSGIGMSIVANRFNGIYAGLVWQESVAIEAKEDDNINVLVLPADYISQEQACVIIEKWLATQFKSGQYQKRLDSIDQLVDVC